MLALFVSSLALRVAPPLFSSASRRSILAATGQFILGGSVAGQFILGGSVAAAQAFDLPPPNGLVAAFNPYDPQALQDPEVRRAYASKPSPDLAMQWSSAYYAVNSGDMETLQAMADGGWVLSELADDSGRTLLHRAAQLGNEPALKLLLKMGSPQDIDAYTSYKETPLHLAVRNNRLSCVKTLVEAGASTSALYSTNGDTALTLARKYKFAAIVEYLTNKSAA